MKRILLGRVLASHKQEHQLLPKTLALPVFSSDPLSSNAYATEEMMLVLVLAGAGAFRFMVPIAIPIVIVLAIVITSYRQTVRAYPSGGGSYIVAHENLGKLPGVVAASALLSDYVLTVSVSITAGVLAITSAVPELADDKVLLSLLLVAGVALANLRGVKEAGTLFAFPTYGFVVTVYVMLATGLARCLIGGCPQADTAALPLHAEQGVTLFLILRAFASGSTALTGVEAISNGVQAFRRPKSRNAANTLALMGAMTIGMFIGITLLARWIDVRVTEEIALERSVLSQVGGTVFGDGSPMFFVLQAFTALILILAANTAYQDFPRLSAILARDRFMPRQLMNRGDRLVYSNGIVVLSVLGGVLIWAFDANLTRLIQLYLVGVFTAFTLSQTGMVRHWFKLRDAGWKRRAIINGIGATATGIVLVIITATKFTHGAWIVVSAIPVIILFLLFVHRHYTAVGRALRARGFAPVRGIPNTFVILVPDLDLGTVEAIAYLRTLRPERVVPLYIGAPGGFDETADRWQTFAPRMGRLERLPMDRERVVRSLRAHLRSIRREQGEGFLTVVVPEVLTSRSLLRQLGRGSTFWLKASLLFEAGIVVTDVPLLPEERTLASAHAERPLEPIRNVVLIPVAGVHAGTAQAVSYATSLNATSVEALFFRMDPEEEDRMVREWVEGEVDVPLTIVDAPLRDLTGPVLEEVRRHTSREGTIVTVVLPEFVVSHWWEHLLHNQTALFFKRLLLFEPRVVVTSVPFHLARGRQAQAPGPHGSSVTGQG